MRRNKSPHSQYYALKGGELNPKGLKKLMFTRGSQILAFTPTTTAFT
jgi:hypothetical protein